MKKSVIWCINRITGKDDFSVMKKISLDEVFVTKSLNPSFLLL